MLASTDDFPLLASNLLLGAKLKKILIVVGAVLVVGSGLLLFLNKNTTDSVEHATAGLDQSVVAEALAHPSVKDDLKNYVEPERSAAVQAFARRIVWCRETLAMFDSWQATGKAQPIPDLPEPSNPAEPFYSGLKKHNQDFLSEVQSNGFEAVRSLLASDGDLCTEIPAEPNNPSGPTIRDVMRGKQ